MEMESRVLSSVLVMALTAGLVYAGSQGLSIKENTEEEESAWYSRSDTIYFWYSDESMSDYISKAAVDFGERENVHVLPVLVSGDDYLEAINRASITNQQMPDAYMLSHENIEMAYLSGLACVIEDENGICTEDYFSEGALNAVTYDGKLLGYPFSYNTTALLYNEVYLHDWAGQKALAVLTGTDDAFVDGEYFEELIEEVNEEDSDTEGEEGQEGQEGQETTDEEGQTEDTIVTATTTNEAEAEEEDDTETIPYEDLSEEMQAEVLATETEKIFSRAVPNTIDDLLIIADTYDASVGVDGVMTWDVSDIMYNFWIIGDVTNLGGPAGDDKAKIFLKNDPTIRCLQYYQYLHQFFSIESDAVHYENVVKDFIDGRMMFTIASVDAVATLEQAYADGTMEFDYSFAMIPDVREDILSKPMSMTTAVIINSYSEKREIANAFAQYLVNDFATEIYSRTGRPACNIHANAAYPGLEVFDAEYARSIPLPKIIELENFWMELEALFARVWNEANVQEELEKLENTVNLYFE